TDRARARAPDGARHTASGVRHEPLGASTDVERRAGPPRAARPASSTWTGRAESAAGAGRTGGISRRAGRARLWHRFHGTGGHGAGAAVVWTGAAVVPARAAAVPACATAVRVGAAAVRVGAAAVRVAAVTGAGPAVGARAAVVRTGRSGGQRSSGTDRAPR